MVTPAAVPWIDGLLFSAALLFTVAVLFVGLILSVIVCRLLRRSTGRTKNQASPPPSNWESSREHETSQINRKRKPSLTAAARAERVQSMIAAHSRGLKRLHGARKKGIHTTRAIRMIRKRMVRDSESDNETAKQDYLQLSALKRAKENELSGWVQGITAAASNDFCADKEGSFSEKSHALEGTTRADEPVPIHDRVTMETLKSELSLVCQSKQPTMNSEQSEGPSLCNLPEDTQRKFEVRSRRRAQSAPPEIEGTIRLKLGRNNKINSLFDEQSFSDRLFIDTDL